MHKKIFSRRSLLKYGIALAAITAGGAWFADQKQAKASGSGYYRGVLPSGTVLVPYPAAPFAVVSNSGQYTLILQSDGNLVLYEECGTALWASNTAGIAVTSCNMQTDGNLVIYAGESGPVWASNTYGCDGAHLEVQDDGNVVIYDVNHNPIWATDTQAPGVRC